VASQRVGVWRADGQVAFDENARLIWPHLGA
jgi:hypothetical protein